MIFQQVSAPHLSVCIKISHLLWWRSGPDSDNMVHYRPSRAGHRRAPRTFEWKLCQALRNACSCPWRSFYRPYWSSPSFLLNTRVGLTDRLTVRWLRRIPRDTPNTDTTRGFCVVQRLVLVAVSTSYDSVSSSLDCHLIPFSMWPETPRRVRFATW
jgi:hypothetical protein